MTPETPTWCIKCRIHLTYGKQLCPVCTDKQHKATESDRVQYWRGLAS